MIRLRHIEIFYAVMIHGSVSGAARMLNLSQPAATRLLQHAEHYWGFPLFERVKNRLTPTSAAQQLFPEVERAYQQFSVIRHQITHLKQHSQQHIRIASTHSLSQHLMPEVVHHIRRHFPHALPEIYNMRSRTIVNQILEHKVELGIIYMGIDHPLLHTTHLVNSPLYAVYPDAWVLPAHLSPLEQLALLAQKPMIYFPSEDPAGHVITTWLNSVGIEVTPSVLLHNLQTGLSMVTHHLGWSILDHAVLYGSPKPLEGVKTLALPEAPCLTLHIIQSRELVPTPLIDCCIKGIFEWTNNRFT